MKVKKGSLSYWILEVLEDIATSEILEGLSYSAQLKYFLDLSSIKPNTKRSALAAALRRVKNKGLIEQGKSQDSKVVLRLTGLGRECLGKEENWDGKYRIVIWDIPESKRRLRDLFRRKLKEWKFVSWQKSVWVSKRNVTENLRNLITELQMDRWVVVIESDDPSLSNIDFHDRGNV